MTLKEDIQRLSQTRKVSEVESFLSTYLKDRLVFGESTADIYADVFGELMGEDYTNLFEGVDEKFNPDMLLEANGGVPADIAKAISTYRETNPPTLNPSTSYGGMPSSVIKAINSYSASQANKGGFLSKIGAFLKGIKDGFVGSKVFDSFKNGLAWMISPAGLPIVVGSAAGIGVIAAIINSLRKRGKNKEAEKLAAALEAAKAKKGK